MTIENGEIWKKVPSLDRYEASNYGIIRSYRYGKYVTLTGHPDKDGYIKHTLYKDGKNVYRRRASLVAEAWLGSKPDKLVVCHKNGKLTDDRPDNLEYKTQKENIHDKFKHDTISHGSRNGNSKILEIDAAYIFVSADSWKELCEKYNISRTVVDDIRKRKTWKRVTDSLIKGNY